ncbi:MAG: hypothetical protein ACR2J3_13350, partial [Aridibacter sp.]
NKKIKKVDLEKRKNEKGAALIMVLLISFLLLVASAGLLLEVTLHSANVTDAVAEQQAYNAAESGIQSALNVLRGNTPPNPLLDTGQNSSHPNNRIDFKKAITLSQSNKSGDTSTEARLSRWLTYDATFNDRIVLGTGTGTTYTEANGYAYNVAVKDPDNTGVAISYSTSGKIDGGTSYKTFSSGNNTATISYVSKTVNNLNVSSGSANTDLGSFKIETGSTSGVPIPTTRFEINLNMTKPYEATRVIRGTIESGNLTNNSVGTVKINFDTGKYELMGSITTITNDPLTPNPPSINSGEVSIDAAITQAEPIRLIIKSVGYGPRGARKELEAVVRKNFFDGLTVPTTLLMVGKSSGFEFQSGNSQNVTYSGEDVAPSSSLVIPPIGVTNDTNLVAVGDDLNGSGNKTDVIPRVYVNATDELPTWLKSAENLNSTLQALKNVAKSSGRYFSSGQTPTNFGDKFNATGITYIDGDVSINKDGGGILVVTGKLELKGGIDFNGLIIVTGTQGLDRSGGGNGTIQGNVVVAPYDPSNLTAGFLGPKYTISGGGISKMTYNSSSLANGLTAVSNFILGVAEK